jgi:hypothetical protein
MRPVNPTVTWPNHTAIVTGVDASEHHVLFNGLLTHPDRGGRLSQIAEQTGGEAYYLGFGAPVSFVPYLDDLTRRLTRQYLLTFLAKPEKKAGFQRIKLTTEVPNAELVGADSVYVPAGS